MSRARMVVNADIAGKIVRMLVRGFTQRNVARTLGVPRYIVSRVAIGQQVTRQPLINGLLGGRDGFGLWPVRIDIQQPERCPTCGGKVYMPCRLCLLRKNMGEES